MTGSAFKRWTFASEAGGHNNKKIGNIYMSKRGGESEGGRVMVGWSWPRAGGFMSEGLKHAKRVGFSYVLAI